MLIKAIQTALKKTTNHQELLEVMDYAVLPAGKLFRPRLVEALAKDIGKGLDENLTHLGAAIELHHAYTLVHDDLPSMDNDLIRRGKPSTHAQYGEWKAILAGDALLITSFEELNKIEHKNFKRLLKLMTWATGSRGLIEGQFRDLKANGELSLVDVVRVHELKTARLIQLATLGTYFLTQETNLRGTIEFFRLGREIGVSFQLLDDLSELAEENVSDHEKKINPFIQSLPIALNELKASHKRLVAIIKKHKLENTEKMLDAYFLNNKENLLSNFKYLEENIVSDLSELKKWITSFA